MESIGKDKPLQVVYLWLLFVPLLRDDITPEEIQNIIIIKKVKLFNVVFRFVPVKFFRLEH